MDQRIKKLWVEALRSNKYKQGKYSLRIGDEFCCLGVICDISIKEQGGEWLFDGSEYHVFKAPNGFNATALLPPAVSAWAKLNTTSPSVEVDGVRTNLSELNDDSHTFAQIADLIEAQL